MGLNQQPLTPIMTRTKSVKRPRPITWAPLIKRTKRVERSNQLRPRRLIFTGNEPEIINQDYDDFDIIKLVWDQSASNTICVTFNNADFL